MPPPEPAQQLARIRLMERDFGMPVKAFICAVLFYYLFFSNWYGDTSAPAGVVGDSLPMEQAMGPLRLFFILYVIINIAVACLLLGMRQLPFHWVQQVVFTIAWVDSLFVSALLVFTGGFDSILYWVFVGMIIRNAVSIPIASRLIVLNVIVTLCYLLAGLADILAVQWQSRMLDEKVLAAVEEGPMDGASEPFLLRLSLLILMSVCCYGVQVLFDRQRLAEAEAREFALRQQQLQATGRLAAEIAHQLKNPLGIINNAAFTLQRTIKEGKTITQQVQIIREEVQRSDKIITELMGYAQLTEGRVERVNVAEELDRALQQVFPPALKFEVRIARSYAPALPPLLMQRNHFSEIFVNLFQNAGEAMNGKGAISVAAANGEDYTVIVSVADNGPGIPLEKVGSIFEPYFTTKERGTGLGLAIVKHNAEIYGGKVDVESQPGKGTCFTITLPARTIMKIRK